MPELTYTQLVTAITTFQTTAARGRDVIEADARRIDEIATDTAQIAEAIAALSVDTATVSETKDLAKTLHALGTTATGYAVAGDVTAGTAKAAADQTRTTHAGIHEAYSRAPVDLSGVNREWLRQE
ncbi:hypothetical protein [Streptomyces cinereoruber]|uniref:hypothetical protein n=1 Tax=Streptomyces cinereoruber TaxID=67260 RepID=UPI0036354859